MTVERQRTVVTELQEVRQRLHRYRNRNDNMSEADTKAALIEPLLLAMGWDTFDIEEVKREYRHKSPDNPVDYALFVGRKPLLFVEAKGLKEKMDDRKWITQTVNYANAVGVEWCVLTNGDEYRIYNSHAPCDVEEKLFSSVQISNLAQEQSTLDILDLISKDRLSEKKIDNLWKAHFIDRRVGLVLQGLLKGNDQSFIKLIRKETPDLTPSQIKESLLRADIQIDYPTVTPSTVLSDTSPGLRHTSAASPRPTQLSGTSQKKPAKSKTGKTSPAFIGVEVKDLIEAGMLRPPIQLEKDYKGHHLIATILEDGQIDFGGDVYNSLSISAAMARKTIVGAPPGREYPQTNGWEFWKIKNPDTGKIEEIDTIRQKFLKQR